MADQIDLTRGRKHLRRLQAVERDLVLIDVAPLAVAVRSVGTRDAASELVGVEEPTGGGGDLGGDQIAPGRKSEMRHGRVRTLRQRDRAVGVSREEGAAPAS